MLPSVLRASSLRPIVTRTTRAMAAVKSIETHGVRRLGWTLENYSRSMIWLETRKLTKEHSPSLFVCDFNDYGDCTAV